MQWFSANKWLFDGIGAIVIVGIIGFLLKRYVFTERVEPAVVRDSQLTGSPVASGSQITQHNYFAPIPTPVSVSPAPATTAPKVYIRPRPNIGGRV